MENYDIALQLLDDIDTAYESSFDDLGPKKNPPQNAINKVMKLCSRALGGLISIIRALITWIRQITIAIFGKIRKMPRTAIVVDKYGYVDVICKASDIINNYYECLVNLYELDAEINKAMSVMDDVKDKLSSSTIRFVKDSESKLQQEIKVKKNFDIISQYDIQLKLLLDNTLDNPVEITKPKRYTIDSLEKVISHNLDSKKKQLESLCYTLEMAKQVYEDRSWIYKKVHKTDIERNRDMINWTSALLSRIQQYKVLYTKLVADFE